MVPGCQNSSTFIVLCTCDGGDMLELIYCHHNRSRKPSAPNSCFLTLGENDHGRLLDIRQVVQLFFVRRIRSENRRWCHPGPK